MLKIHSHNWRVLKQHALNNGRIWMDAIVMFGAISVVEA